MEARMRKSREKFEKLGAVYDFPEALKSREVLQAKVLKSSPGKVRQEGSDKSELLNQWLEEERKLADAAAEEHWKAKFIDWHTTNAALAGEAVERALINRRTPAEHQEDLQQSQLSESASWDLDPEDPEVVALLRETELLAEETRQMSSKHDEIERDIGRFRDEIAKEQQQREYLGKQLQLTIADRDSWSTSAARHELMRKRFAKETQETNKQVSDLQSSIAAIGDTLTVVAETE
jgi:hypothetical protein